jgi:hypothetical protein
MIKKEAITVNRLNFYKKVIIMTCTKRIPVVRKKNHETQFLENPTLKIWIFKKTMTKKNMCHPEITCHYEVETTP